MKLTLSPSISWPYSKISLLLIIVSLCFSSFIYYPKWNKTKTEATISWDTSGYYLYLPAIFIYKDLKKLNFYTDILDKYHPTPDFQQAYPIANGNYVMKYSAGMACFYFPAFICGHIYASLTDYPADGYSTPYQFALHMYSFLIACLGLVLWFLFLRRYFTDKIIAMTLLSICLGSNYLAYSGITNAMSHNYLLCCYSILLLLTDNFYKTPKWAIAVGIGLVVGMMALSRPTELIAGLIPVFWLFDYKKANQYLAFINTHKSKIILAGLTCALIGSLQLIYWKYVSDSWFQYSYEDQGFSFLHPHIQKGLFHINNGWLIYSPIMLISILGFYYLFRSSLPFKTIIIFYCALFIYVVFSWDIWWYGGSLGQRTMVQLSPVLSIPFASFISSTFKYKKFKIVLIVISVLLIYYNLWVTHHAHHGSYYLTERMSKKFLLHTIGKNEVSKNAFNLLDKGYYFDGFRNSVESIYEYSFKEDGLQNRLVLDRSNPKTNIISIPITKQSFDWLRVKGVANQRLESSHWKYTSLKVLLYSDKQLIKEKNIRINYNFKKNGHQAFTIDIPKPRANLDKISLQFRHGENAKPIEIISLNIETFSS